jgi:hypothetical protein
LDGNEGVSFPEPHSEKQLRNHVDYMTVPAENIWKIEPEMTVIGGEVVYTQPMQAKK